MRKQKPGNSSGSNSATAGRRTFARDSAGFSLIELIISMLVTLVILGAGVAAFTSGLKMRDYESSRTDALTSAQAAMNIMSREIGNSGFGLARDEFETNGLWWADCNEARLHFRANTNNSNLTTSDPGEDVTFYYDDVTQSVVRYDASGGGSSSGVINRVSRAQFIYHNYESDGTSTIGAASDKTARVTMRLTVLLTGDENNADDPRNVTFESDITLRNSPYGLGRY